MAEKRRTVLKQYEPITTYEEAVNYLYQVPYFTTKNTPADTRGFLSELGNPDQKMRIIHVAGTNGKGSVCAYMRNILEAAGYTTAVFTSPHLVDIRERFLIKGQMVEKEAFLRAFLKVYNLIYRNPTPSHFYHPTFFEYLFFMAMILFEEAAPDYCILETGLGGRLDATNSVSKKELSVITSIGVDHVEYLGNTLEQIAGEKAGIIHPNAPVIFADNREDISRIFREKAQKLGTAIYPVSRNDYAFLSFHDKTIDFSYQSMYYGYVRFTLRTIATYQMANAALALRAIEVLDGGRSISPEHMIQGVGNTFWPGRMEEVLPDVFVDGAHNEDGIRAFLQTVQEDGCEGNRMLLFGVVQDKDFTVMAKELIGSGLFSRIAVARLQSARTASLENLEEIFANQNTYNIVNAYTMNAYSMHDSADAALRELLKEKQPGDRIYVAGSLYLVGEIKESLAHD